MDNIDNNVSLLPQEVALLNIARQALSAFAANHTSSLTNVVSAMELLLGQVIEGHVPLTLKTQLVEAAATPVVTPVSAETQDPPPVIEPAAIMPAPTPAATEENPPAAEAPISAPAVAIAEAPVKETKKEEPKASRTVQMQVARAARDKARIEGYIEAALADTPSTEPISPDTRRLNTASIASNLRKNHIQDTERAIQALVVLTPLVVKDYPEDYSSYTLGLTCLKLAEAYPENYNLSPETHDKVKAVMRQIIDFLPAGSVRSLRKDAVRSSAVKPVGIASISEASREADSISSTNPPSSNESAAVSVKEPAQTNPPAVEAPATPWVADESVLPAVSNQNDAPPARRDARAENYQVKLTKFIQGILDNDSIASMPSDERRLSAARIALNLKKELVDNRDAAIRAIARLTPFVVKDFSGEKNAYHIALGELKIAEAHPDSYGLTPETQSLVRDAMRVIREVLPGIRAVQKRIASKLTHSPQSNAEAPVRNNPTSTSTSIRTGRWQGSHTTPTIDDFSRAEVTARAPRRLAIVDDEANRVEVTKLAAAAPAKKLTGISLDTLYAEFVAKLADPATIPDLKTFVDIEARQLKARGRTGDVYEFKWELLSHFKPLLMREDLAPCGEELISLFASVMSQINRVHARPKAEQTAEMESLIGQLMEGKGVGVSKAVRAKITEFDVTNHHYRMYTRALAGKRPPTERAEPPKYYRARGDRSANGNGISNGHGTPNGHSASNGNGASAIPHTAEHIDTMTRALLELCRETMEAQEVRPGNGSRIVLGAVADETASTMLVNIGKGVRTKAAIAERASFSRLLQCTCLIQNRKIDEQLMSAIEAMGNANRLMFVGWPYPCQQLERVLKNPDASDEVKRIADKCITKWRDWSIEEAPVWIRNVQARKSLGL